MKRTLIAVVVTCSLGTQAFAGSPVSRSQILNRRLRQAWDRTVYRGSAGMFVAGTALMPLGLGAGAVAAQHQVKHAGAIAAAGAGLSALLFLGGGFGVRSKAAYRGQRRVEAQHRLWRMKQRKSSANTNHSQ